MTFPFKFMVLRTNPLLFQGGQAGGQPFCIVVHPAFMRLFKLSRPEQYLYIAIRFLQLRNKVMLFIKKDGCQWMDGLPAIYV